jgi:Ca2+-binding EF-hand superfamily protein
MKLLSALLLLMAIGLGDLQAQQQRPGGSTGRGGSFGRQMDANGDGKISREEFPGPKEMFDQFDKDKNNFLSEEERNAMRQSRMRGGFGRGNSGGGFRRPGQGQGNTMAQELFGAVDANKDSKLSPKEWQAYFDKILTEADKDKNGDLSAEEWQTWRQRRQSRSSGRPDRGLKVGAMAPEITAEFMTQKGSLDFSKIKHLSVVIFGSYT